MQVDHLGLHQHFVESLLSSDLGFQVFKRLRFLKDREVLPQLVKNKSVHFQEQVLIQIVVQRFELMSKQQLHILIELNWEVLLLSGGVTQAHPRRPVVLRGLAQVLLMDRFRDFSLFMVWSQFGASFIVQPQINIKRHQVNCLFVFELFQT